MRVTCVCLLVSPQAGAISCPCSGLCGRHSVFVMVLKYTVDQMNERMDEGRSHGLYSVVSLWLPCRSQIDFGSIVWPHTAP